MYHSFLIHSSADGHLSCLHVLTIINSAAKNIGVHVSLSILVSSISETLPTVPADHLLRTAEAPSSPTVSWSSRVTAAMCSTGAEPRVLGLGPNPKSHVCCHQVCDSVCTSASCEHVHGGRCLAGAGLVTWPGALSRPPRRRELAEACK